MLEQIKLVIFDVDGVLTDGRIIFDSNGVETKFFHVLDGTGIKFLMEAGLEVVVGEASAPDKHPGSMPDTSDLTVKLVFVKQTGVIIGGQAYGGASTGELVNFIGAVIQQKATADEIAVFQVGTHPALTASPIAYQVVNAAENALVEMR